MSNIAFEHFDPEIELCNLDENGRPIRPRKKPGRKPNPPSAAQRKAQNRTAQRAFRERKRREMREAETTVKYSLRKVQKLQTEVDELRFENNYLKGQLLTYKLACCADRVDLPKFSDTGIRDELGADRPTFSRTKGVPQSLEFFLDRHLHIIQASGDMTLACSAPPPAILDQLLAPPPFSSPLLSTSPPSSYSCSDNTSTLFTQVIADSLQLPVDISHITSHPPQLASQLCEPLLQQLYGNTNLFYPPISPTSPTSTITTPTMSIFPDKERVDHTIRPDPLDALVNGYQALKLARVTTDISDKEYSRIREQVVKNKLHPMSALEAITYLRAIQQLDESKIPALFTPTELQRAVPHDARIDLIPGEAMRDHMILFQDFYDSDELFNFLIQTGYFLGGELGNPDCWFVPPAFLQKYWFLCPNHMPERVDNVVDIMVQLSKRTIEVLQERKKMYIHREQFADLFPPLYATSETNESFPRIPDDDLSLDDNIR